MDSLFLTVVSTSRLEWTGKRCTSNNSLEESQALPRWQSCEENLFVLLPRQQLWIGGEEEKDRWLAKKKIVGGESGREERERREERESLGRRGNVKITGRRWKKRWSMMSCCLREEGMSSPFIVPPSLPCLGRMILDCVGEFTVCCNLIPNKVTQQILLSQMDAATLLWDGSSDRTQWVNGSFTWRHV